MPNADKVLLLGVDGKTAATAANPLPVTTETSGSDQPISDGSAEDTTGTITTPTGVVTATNLDGYSTVTMSISGTYAAFTAVFEQSDDGGVSWFAVDMDRTGSGIVENGCINLTNASLLYRGSTSGSDSFRIRATALTSGTVSVRMSVSAMPTASGVALTTNFTDLRPDSGNITIQDTGSSTATGQNSASLITGTPTVGSTFSYAINGVAGVYVLVTGTWTGTLQYEKSIDGGTTWTPTSFHIDSTAYTQVAITANCSARGASAGATNLRVRATAAMTGTAVVRIVFAAADTVTTVNNAGRLFDNTSGATATIKPASTAAAATDTALVTALSPATHGFNADNADGVAGSATVNALKVMSRSTLWDGANGQWDLARIGISTLNTAGFGVQAVGMSATFDDVAPTAITENNYGAVRMSANRNLYGTIRDAAGNERGANVDANNNLGTVPSGNVASGVADAGNPVKVGGVYYSSKATATTGQRLDLTLSGTGGLVVGAIAVPADGAANNSTNLNSISSGNSGGFPTQIFPYGYNGSTWNRTRDVIGAVAAGTGTAAVALAPTSASTGGIAAVVTSVAGSNVVVKASAGNLYGFNVCLGGTAGYVMVFNATSKPVDGTVTPIKVYAVAANQSLEVGFSPPLYCSTGITIAFSSTGPFSLTASATAFLSGDAT